MVPWTVRTGTLDRPAWAADCPLKPTEPSEANPEKRIVRGEHADCPPGTRGLSALHTRTVRNLAQPKLENTTDRKRRRARTRRTREEQRALGPFASPSRTVRASRTDPEIARPRRSTPPNHHRISQTVELLRQEFGDLISVKQGCCTPKISPPNSLNHRESRIL
jgi:hypothetical protein